jgi:hypothetical protein
VASNAKSGLVRIGVEILRRGCFPALLPKPEAPARHTFHMLAEIDKIREIGATEDGEQVSFSPPTMGVQPPLIAGKGCDALEWLAAMCSHVPNNGEQMVRYYKY